MFNPCRDHCMIYAQKSYTEDCDENCDYAKAVKRLSLVDNKTMKIGYIVKTPNGFSFREAAYTRKISSRGDKIYSKMLLCPIDYDEILDNTEIMKTEGLVVVQEPFLLDDELREKAIRWCESLEGE